MLIKYLYFMQIFHCSFFEKARTQSCPYASTSTLAVFVRFCKSLRHNYIFLFDLVGWIRILQLSFSPSSALTRSFRNSRVIHILLFITIFHFLNNKILSTLNIVAWVIDRNYFNWTLPLHTLFLVFVAYFFNDRMKHFFNIFASCCWNCKM